LWGFECYCEYKPSPTNHLDIVSLDYDRHSPHLHRAALRNRVNLELKCRVLGRHGALSIASRTWECCPCNDRWRLSQTLEMFKLLPVAKTEDNPFSVVLNSTPMPSGLIQGENSTHVEWSVQFILSIVAPNREMLFWGSSSWPLNRCSTYSSDKFVSNDDNTCLESCCNSVHSIERDCPYEHSYLSTIKSVTAINTTTRPFNPPTSINTQTL
jgi:hypothetical protein